MSSDLFTTRAPEVPLGAPVFTPPLSRYVDEDDTLVVDSWSSTSPAPLVITAVVVTPQGQVQTLSWTHTQNSNRTRATNYFPLAEGFLLSVIVDAMGLAYNRGQCWCTVGLQLGSGSVCVPHSQLIADYITGAARLAWPGGIIRSAPEGPGLISSVAGNDPAAGAEISVTVPTGARWRLVGLLATLVTDATVANRTVNLVIDDGANAVFRAAAQTAQTASLTVIYSFGASLPSQATAGGVSINPLAEALPLAAGYRIRTVTTNIAGGDNWGAPQLLIEEWIQP